MDKIKQQKIFEYSMLIGSILSCFIGVWLVGETYSSLIRSMLGLSEQPIESLILPLVFLLIVAIIGTVILFLAFGIKNKAIKITVILFSILIPTILDSIDLIIRSINIYNEVISNPEILINFLL